MPAPQQRIRLAVGAPESDVSAELVQRALLRRGRAGGAWWTRELASDVDPISLEPLRALAHAKPSTGPPDPPLVRPFLAC